MRANGTQGRSGLRGQLSVACALLCLAGCSVYDSKLLQFSARRDASTGSGGSMSKDAQAEGHADAGPTHDAGRMLDASQTFDAAQDVDSALDAGSGDAEVEGGAEVTSDAGCLSSTNHSGIDCCPDDDFKTEPGMCGCGMSETDADADGVPDCTDACPNDEDKSELGICGCDHSDTDEDGVVSCAGLKDALAHRYRFDGSGTTATDSIADADGTIVMTELSDTGALALAGGTSDQYVDLPNGIASSLKNATFEAWLTWNGGGAWQRIFDFGDPTSGGEGAQASGRSYLFVTTASGASSGALRVTYRRTGGNEVIIDASKAVPSGVITHVAVVVDDDNDLLAVYIDGVLEKSTALDTALSDINDINNWIGRSQFSNDPELNATVHEFRIYNAALSAEQLALSFGAGPDPAFLEP